MHPNSSELDIYENISFFLNIYGKIKNEFLIKNSVQLSLWNTKHMKKLRSIDVLLGFFGEAQILL